MIGRITGTLLEKNPPQILVDVHGVGYEIDVPMSTFYNLPHTGEKVVLFTHLIVREDAHLLFGFGTTTEKALFRELIQQPQVDGVYIQRFHYSIVDGINRPSTTMEIKMVILV